MNYTRHSLFYGRIAELFLYTAGIFDYRVELCAWLCFILLYHSDTSFYLVINYYCYNYNNLNSGL